MDIRVIRPVQNIITIEESSPSGQHVVGIAIHYNAPVQTSICAEDYLVEGRKITRAYTNAFGFRSSIAKPGEYVILELEVDEDTPNTYRGVGEKWDHRCFRIPQHAIVTQVNDVVLTDGVRCDPFVAESTKEQDEIVDKFHKDVYEGLKYNLFVPNHYDAASKYPLVLFIEDASCLGNDVELPLLQGIGATVWARPEEQKKNPCFVLAPQFPGPTLTHDDFTYTDDVDRLKLLLKHILATYPVDMSRIYTTGQSMGCMTSCLLNEQMPDLFAASLLVASPWNPETMASLYEKNFWFIVSNGDAKAFPCFTSIVDAMEAKGAKVSRQTLDPRMGVAALNEAMRNAYEAPTNVKLTILSDLPFGENEKSYNCHSHTWEIAYELETVRDWLFEQKKG